jgi:hypothetical protein
VPPYSTFWNRFHVWNSFFLCNSHWNRAKGHLTYSATCTGIYI